MTLHHDHREREQTDGYEQSTWDYEGPAQQNNDPRQPRLGGGDRGRGLCHEWQFTRKHRSEPEYRRREELVKRTDENKRLRSPTIAV